MHYMGRVVQWTKLTNDVIKAIHIGKRFILRYTDNNKVRPLTLALKILIER